MKHNKMPCYSYMEEFMTFYPVFDGHICIDNYVIHPFYSSHDVGQVTAFIVGAFDFVLYTDFWEFRNKLKSFMEPGQFLSFPDSKTIRIRWTR